MAHFAVLTLLGLSTLCAIGSINQASAQSSSLVDVNALVQVLNTISSSRGGGGREGGSPSLLNINLLVQLLNGLLAGGHSGTVGTSTLTDMCNRASTSRPSSSKNNTNSLIAIRILIQILNTIANASSRGGGGGGGGRGGSSGTGSLISVNALVSLLNSISGSGSRSGGTGSSSGGSTTRPLIGVDVLLQALNSYRTSRTGGGRRYCHIGQLNQLLQSEADNAGEDSSGGSILDADDILPILNRVTYPPTRSAANNNSLIRVNIIIDVLNQLLGGSRGRRGTQTGNDALVSIDVNASILNNCPKNGGGLLGLVGNLLQGLLGPGGLGGLLNGLLGGVVGEQGLLGGVLGGLG